MEHAGSIRPLLDGEVESGRLPGASWRVEDVDGVLDAGAVGFVSVEPAGEPASERTPYDLASLTKPLATALVLLRLQAQGRLDLRAPIGETVEELRGSPHGNASMLDVGAHRAGLPAWSPLYLGEHDATGFLRAIAAAPPVGPRGTTVYSDLGYLALGVAAERAAGSPLDRLFDELVARPIGLDRLGFATDRLRFADAAASERGNGYERALAGAAGRGHAWREAIPRGEVHDGNAHALGGVAGHAGLFGTAAEVAAVALEMLRPARLPLPERERGLLLRPVAGEGSRTFGFTVAALSSAARDALPPLAPGHTGFTGTSVWLEPATGTVLVLLANRVHPEVPARDFQTVRREFHRRARVMLRSR